MITLAEAQAATQGEWLASPLTPDTTLLGGTVDTRKLAGADVFIALKGERTDGHEFLSSLAGSDIKLALVSRDVEVPGFGGNILRVEDTLVALGQLGAAAVEKHRPKVVAITGSYGKTTAKEVIAHILDTHRKVLKTPGSFNNEIGLPLSLLRLDGSQDTAVLEFSARNPGDIAYLSRIAPPDVAILLAVGRAHIGVFGSQEAIYKTKGEIFQYLRPDGLAIVGAEDPRLAQLAAGHPTVSFGRGCGDYRAENVTENELGCQGFEAVHEGQRINLQSGIPGPHGLYPLLAAWAVAQALGVPDSEVVARAGFHPGQKGRAMPLKGPGGSYILDDTYNASPETVSNLARTLASLPGERRILVLGHLSELEDGLEASSAAIAESIGSTVDELWVCAPQQPAFADQLAQQMNGVSVRAFSGHGEVITALQGVERSGVVIGLKGARSAHMERVVEGVMDRKMDCHLPACGLIIHCTDCGKLTGQG